MAYSLVQPSLAGGEISPSLYGRIDLEKYQTSLRRCRNFIGSQAALKIVPGSGSWGARNMQIVTAG